MYLPLVQKQTFILTLAALRAVSAKDLETPSSPLSEPADAVVVGHLFPACNGQRIGGHKSLTVPVDRCLTTPGLGLEIKTAAVCSNGTRARLARFEDKKCGRGILSETWGLVDIADSDVGACMPTGMAEGGEVKSVAFWCDGVQTKSSPEDDEEEKEPDTKKPKAGSVSEAVCVPGKAPFFSHPKTDTCVKLRTSKLRIISAAICENGTKSTLALYEDKLCLGDPKIVKIKKKDTKSCMDLEGISGFAFYCTGEGIAGNPGSPSNPDKPSQSGGAMQFLLVLSLIFIMFFLMLVLSIFTWVRKYGGSVGKLIDFAQVSSISIPHPIGGITNISQGFLKPKEGPIAI
jgi:hypothetical protein